MMAATLPQEERSSVNELAKLPAALFSPAKMVYIAYLILLVWKTAAPSHCSFF
jgi:hypothetical protein